MGSSKASTGRTSPETGLRTKEGTETYGDLNALYDEFSASPEADAISKAGMELLTRDTLARNLGLAHNLIADETASQQKGLSRSLLSRGVSDSGFATSQLLSSGNEISGKFLNDAVARSSQEELQGKLGGSELIKGLMATKTGLAGLLSDYVANLLGAGTAGQASNYGARQAGKTASNTLLGKVL